VEKDQRGRSSPVKTSDSVVKGGKVVITNGHADVAEDACSKVVVNKEGTSPSAQSSIVNKEAGSEKDKDKKGRPDSVISRSHGVAKKPMEKNKQSSNEARVTDNVRKTPTSDSKLVPRNKPLSAGKSKTDSGKVVKKGGRKSPSSPKASDSMEKLVAVSPAKLELIQERDDKSSEDTDTGKGTSSPVVVETLLASDDESERKLDDVSILFNEPI